MKFVKYHGLGNDYLVFNPRDFRRLPSRSQIRLLCHRNYGLGSDGILWGPLHDSHGCDFALRIFNPDGSEAEKSGNGLRIFARYLWDSKLVANRPFTIWTKGGQTTAHVLSTNRVTVDMGRVSFQSLDIPVRGKHREVLNESISAKGKRFTYSAATVGNPHCVIFLDQLSEKLAREYGPVIEVDSRFPRKTNVQFVKVLDRNTIQLEIWERGAGYTLASGSSSCAAAAVAHRLGLCDSRVRVVMPGGRLDIRMTEDHFIRLSGPVTRICSGIVAPELRIR